MQRRYDWAQLIVDFENRGLTHVEFAKRRGINVGNAAKKRAARAGVGSVRFVPVNSQKSLRFDVDWLGNTH